MSTNACEQLGSRLAVQDALVAMFTATWPGVSVLVRLRTGPLADVQYPGAIGAEVEKAVISPGGRPGSVM
jgi:hypothetical protein